MSEPTRPPASTPRAAPAADDPASWPAPGRALSRLGAPEAGSRLPWLVAAASALVAALDFTATKYGPLAPERWPLFYAAYAFSGVVVLVLAARLLRRLVARPEDYYAPCATDGEPWPEDQIARIDLRGGDNG